MEVVRHDGFYIAPFAPDGESLGTGFWSFSKLSAKWIENCRGFLLVHGSEFKASWGQQLQRIETRLTSEDGAGIGTFYLDSIPALSTLYLSGINKVTDEEVTKLFVASLNTVGPMGQLAASATRFSGICSLTDRPLAVVVVWQDPNFSDEDFELVRELSNHFAAAFFLLHLEGNGVSPHAARGTH